MEKIIEEIIDLVNEQRDSQGQISLDKLKTDIGILIIEQSKVNNGVLDGVSQQRELLLAFFDELDELPMGLMHYDREKVVERFIDNNCG